MGLMALSPTGRNRNRALVPLRQPNGQHRRERREDIRQRVLDQPHRKGDAEQLRVSPGHRLILDIVVHGSSLPASALTRAWELYTRDLARQRWLDDSRRPYAVSNGGDREAPSPDERIEIERRSGDLRRLIRDCQHGDRVAKALTAVMEAHPDHDVRLWAASWVPGYFAIGITALVSFYGTVA